MTVKAGKFLFHKIYPLLIIGVASISLMDMLSSQIRVLYFHRQLGYKLRSGRWPILQLLETSRSS